MKKQLLLKYLLPLFLTIITLPAFAQQNITGRVIDAQTRKPLAGANVVYGKNRGATTDANGYFHIPCHLPVHITVSYIGYKTYKKIIHQCSKPVKVPLAVLSYALQNITVQGEQKRVNVQSATASATLNRAALNRQTGLRLRKALNTVPGVQMGSRTPFGGQRITIRGYYPNTGKSANFNGMGYQLLLNNIPITYATGVTVMDAVDFSTLGRVKITKGPSPFYGNAIAGTVNLYTQRPQQEGTTLSEQAMGGSYGLFRNNISLLTKNDNTDMFINYGRQSYNAFRPHDASKKDYLTFSGHYKLSEKEQINTYFSYAHSYEQLAGNITRKDFYARRAVANPKYVNNDGHVKVKDIRVGITSVYSFGRHFSNKSTVFATGGTLDQNYAHGLTYHNNLNYGARTNFIYQQHAGNIGIHGQFGAFLQYSNDAVNGVFIPSSISPPFTPETKPQIPTDDQNYALNYNLFTKWQFALPYEFKVSVGGILNFNKFGIRDMLHDGNLYAGSSTQAKTFNPTFSPSISVLKSYGQKASVYARFTMGDSPPQLSDIIQGDGSVNRQLKPEHANQFEVGTKGRFGNGKVAYELTIFDLEITDRLMTEFNHDVSYTTNVGKQKNKGLEFYLRYNIIQHRDAPISDVKLQLSYTWSHFRYEEFKEYAKNTAGNDSLTADYSGNVAAGVPANMASLGLDINTKRDFYLHAVLKYRDKTPVTFDNETYLKAYSLLSGRIGYKKELGSHFSLDAFVGGNNLTGSTHYNFLFIGQNVDALGDGYIAPAPYKTTFYGGATLKYGF
jgi:iron complex outermembrane receptor protein